MKNAKVICIGGTKGGTGKTTIATNLAVMLSHLKYDLLFVDADKQESSRDFSESRNHELGDSGFTFITLSGSNVITEVKKLKSKYDIILIDVGGSDTIAQRGALTISDLFLTPFAPRSVELWTLPKLELLVAEAKSINENLQAYSFINRADPRGNNIEECATVLSESKEIEFSGVALVYRKVFGAAYAIGQSVTEFQPKDQKAINEIESLFNFILKK